MTIFIYSATASTDGYIAGRDDDMSWLKQFMGTDPGVERMLPRISALLVGRRTYDGDDPNAGDPQKEGAFEGQWEGPQVLLTHGMPDALDPGFTVVHDFESAVTASREAAGADGVVNVLGADVARQCLEAEVLDEVVLFTVPILLGSGTRILQGTSRSFNLELLDQSSQQSVQAQRFRVVRGSALGR